MRKEEQEKKILAFIDKSNLLNKQDLKEKAKTKLKNKVVNK